VLLKNITYGVFIDLGGVDGLIHWPFLSRINHPSEVLELDQML
jgi:small subunit ribosomal protein S1